MPMPTYDPDDDVFDVLVPPRRCEHAQRLVNCVFASLFGLGVMLLLAAASIK